MFGCLRTVGCLTLVAVVGVGGWITRDRWLPIVTGERPAAVGDFDRISDDRRERARNVVESLGRKSGPVFANLTAAEAASLVLVDARRRLPAMSRDVEASVQGDRLVLRTTLDPAEFRGIDALGPIASYLESRQRVSLAGTIEVAEPGRALFTVRDVRINEIIVPSPVLSALVRQIDRRDRADGTPPRAIAFPLPRSVGDVRVGKGRVTLYKNVP
ncbi:MAG: hypothetical protein IT359_09530 [Gemmatimonadaceae bacterium]|nr:hypothetical protein [Gemmatimonadaceae bacterium]